MVEGAECKGGGEYRLSKIKSPKDCCSSHMGRRSMIPGEITLTTVIMGYTPL